MWRTTLRSVAAHNRRVLGTIMAVLLGVAFLSATLMLTATLTEGATDAAAEAYAGTDAVVRSARQLGREDNTERGLIDRSLAERVRKVPGVAEVAVSLQTDARVLGKDGGVVGGPGSVAGNWIRIDRLNPYTLVEGRAPSRPGEVVIDRATAQKAGLQIGQTALIRTPEPVRATVVGLVTFGGASGRGGASYAGFTTDVARRQLMPGPDGVSSLLIAAVPDADPAGLASRVDAVLPDTVEAVTGAQLVREIEDELQGDDQEIFQQAVLAFAGIALAVAAFSTYNTVSIGVAHRTREFALLRAVGASRVQILGTVMVEATIVGIVSAVAGIMAGRLLVVGLLQLMGTLDLATPPAPVSFDASTIITGLVVGVGITVLASLTPAVRASRLAPLAALRDADLEPAGGSDARTAIGTVISLLGVISTVVGATSQTLAATGLGAVATVAGVIVLGPVVARHATAALGAPLANGLGVTGELARRNAMRNPRRTASTAISLMLGVALVTLFSVMAASLAQSIADAVDQQFAGDLTLVGEGRGGLSPDLTPAIAALPEVETASPSGGARVRIDGRNTLATTLDPATFTSVMNLEVSDGALQDLAPDEIAISDQYAQQHDLTLDETVTVEFPDGTTQPLTVGAVYTDDNLTESVGVRLHRDTVLAHSVRPADVTVWIELADGVPLADGQAAVQQIAQRHGAPDVQTAEQFTDTIAAEINQYLTVIYALLAMAIAIAIMSIGTTMSLSIHERTRELGLLRIVGQTRRQSRAMVQSEATLVAFYGSSTGIVLGVFLAWALVSALAEAGFTSLAVPMGPLTATLALGAIAGLLAAIHPAHSASRMDALTALATE